MKSWNGVGDDFSVAQHASDVAALIKSLNLGKVHLIGHSRGGAVALQVATTHPELIRTLILEEAGIGSLLPDTPEKQKSAADEKAFAIEIRAVLATGDFEKAARMRTGWNSYTAPKRGKICRPMRSKSFSTI